MTEDASTYPHHVVQKPRKRTDHVVADFTMLVRVPGQPAALRAFTDAETDEAHRYAADTRGTIVPLPLHHPAAMSTVPTET